MRQSWKIFIRDVARLGRVPRAWIILIGLVITPALYSWVNIAAFRDPYGHTQNIKVAVVNEDKGASNELTGKVDVGSEVIEKLRNNDQLGWQFLDAEEADKALLKGDVYAAVTIPEDFSENLVGMLDGTFAKPQLVYRVNEKNNAIAVKITDTGAKGLDKQITAAFKEQVATVAAENVKDTGTDFESKVTRAMNNTSSAFGETAQEIDGNRQSLARIQGKLDDAAASMSGAKSTVADVSTALGDAQQALTEISSLVDQAQGGIGDFTDQTTDAFVNGASAVADGTAQAQESIADVTAGLNQAGDRFDYATQRANTAIDASAESIAQLKALRDSSTLSPQVAKEIDDAIQRLEEGNESNRRLVGNLGALSKDTQTAAQDVQASADAINQAAADTKATSQTLRDTVTTAIPEINRAMSGLSSTASALSATLEAQKGTMQEADGLLDGVAQQLRATKDTLSDFDTNLAALQDSLRSVQGDVRSLKAAMNSQVVEDITGLNADEIGHFFAEPIELKSETVYPVDSYGSAMAALFTNLSLWIGAFVLMVIFRVEVDKEGFHRVTVGQAYLGRFLLMAAMVIIQAVTVTVGDVLIGVQTVNAPAFVITGVLIGLTYLSIIYALSTSLGHLGRGLCVVLAIIQIPGASGLYPIELLPGFFHAIYPLLPFTYGIDAMRETIGGFYGTHYFQYMGVLAFMFLLFFVCGLVLRKALAHFNVIFNRELRDTELFDYENVQVVGSGYRIADVIQALDSRSGLKKDLDRRAHNWGYWLKLVAIAGIVGVVILIVVSGLLPAQKPLLLAIWTAWCLLVIAAAVTLEYLRISLKQSAELVTLDEDEIKHPARAGVDSGVDSTEGEN
ncbi:YhgE/Pip domain-containing protein [Corynebacterium minutissimum]|uniref:Phage infection protein n=1 Tax=Corynebacterium minutissimum TaxID=38301 RepID=A0A376CRD0_9CORY|nr:YhgE/Pip domain-containing protein [Corynebacterium minutissimum]QRP59884.1 YhgE/Pip domain-containing protein [Corynebacterium minutissimum]STC73688.1 phage infection protein [Corynebacterium minutissimum]